MSVRINIHPILRRFTNDLGIIEVDGSTVGECLGHLVKQFPGIEKKLLKDNGRVVDYVDIYINEESSYPEELVKPIRDGDELHTVAIR